jgi:hypothetical protein
MRCEGRTQRAMCLPLHKIGRDNAKAHGRSGTRVSSVWIAGPHGRLHFFPLLAERCGSLYVRSQQSRMAPLITLMRASFTDSQTFLNARVRAPIFRGD